MQSTFDFPLVGPRSLMGRYLAPVCLSEQKLAHSSSAHIMSRSASVSDPSEWPARPQSPAAMLHRGSILKLEQLCGICRAGAVIQQFHLRFRLPSCPVNMSMVTPTPRPRASITLTPQTCQARPTRSRNVALGQLVKRHA